MNEFLVGLAITASGSLINFIVTKIYNWITGKSLNFFWKKSYKIPDQIELSKSFDELKRNIRILVIDDENFFPVQLFLDAGYAIEKWDKVKDYTKLEKGFYDIIVLDIIGVAGEISDDDGLGVLKSLKEHNPSQLIIAYSGHSFDLSKRKFWDLADETIKKPSDFLKTKEIVDDLIRSKFKPQRYISELLKTIKSSAIDAKSFNVIENKLSKFLVKGDVSKLRNVLDMSQFSFEKREKLISLVQTIAKFFEK